MHSRKKKKRKSQAVLKLLYVWCSLRGLQPQKCNFLWLIWIKDPLWQKRSLISAIRWFLESSLLAVQEVSVLRSEPVREGAALLRRGISRFSPRCRLCVHHADCCLQSLLGNVRNAGLFWAHVANYSNSVERGGFQKVGPPTLQSYMQLKAGSSVCLWVCLCCMAALPFPSQGFWAKWPFPAVLCQ